MSVFTRLTPVILVYHHEESGTKMGTFDKAYLKLFRPETKIVTLPADVIDVAPGVIDELQTNSP